MPRDKMPSSPTADETAERAAEIAIMKDAKKGIEPLVESPVLNKLLLKNARRSPNDIAELTGIPASEVAERLTALLDSGSWRDDLQEEKLLLMEVGMLVDDIRTRMSRFNVEDEGWASMARVQLAALKTLMEQVEKRRKAVDGKLALVTQEQAQLFGAAIKLAQDRAVFNIMKAHPEWDEEVIYAEFEEALPGAIEYLEARASK